MSAGPDRLTDRFLTPRMARAITSPSAILVAGAGVSVALVAGAPVAAAAVVGALAWAGRVALAGLGRGTGEHIDPFAVGEPWRGFVQDALQAQARYRRAVRSARGGPLRDRLGEIGERIDTGVRECWRIARQGAVLERAVADLDLERIERELAAFGADLESPTADALRAQLASARRLTDVARHARDRLQLLDARMDEAVARAIELSVGAGGDIDLHGLGTDVDSLVNELEALRAALHETSGGGGTGAAAAGG